MLLVGTTNVSVSGDDTTTTTGGGIWADLYALLWSPSLPVVWVSLHLTVSSFPESSQASGPRDKKAKKKQRERAREKEGKGRGKTPHMPRAFFFLLTLPWPEAEAVLFPPT